MEVLCSMILCLIQLIVFGVLFNCCCMGDTNIAVVDAFVSCDTNTSCAAKCYRGYIFPSGLTEESYRCQNGVWKPIVSACKRIPVIDVDYVALWTFGNVAPASCDSIAMKLNDSVDVIQEEFSNTCQEMAVNATTMCSYSMVASEIIGTFAAEYYNFTNWFNIETCISVTTISFQNKQIYKHLFDNVTCETENPELSHTIKRDIYNRSIYIHCYNTSEIHNVTRTTDGKVELYCDSGVFESSTQKTTKETAFWSPKVIYIATSSTGGFLLPVIGILLACCIKRCKTPKRPSGEREMSCNCKCNLTLHDFKDEFRGELIENELYQSADNLVE